MKAIKKIIENFQQASTIEEIEKSSEDLNTFFQTASIEERIILQKAISQKTSDMLAETDKAIANAQKILEIEGQKYPLSEWVTLKEYCRLYGLKSTSVVSNWVARGVIPSQNIILIPEMNNLKLIKAVPYLD